MSTIDNLYIGHRLCYDGALCTIRSLKNSIPGTKGEWLGVEWDDPHRGKHNGSYKGKKYFECLSNLPTVASFVRPTRGSDPERTVLQAIKHKYVTDVATLESRDAVVISGKVAEEVGFDKVIKEQSALSNLKVAVLDSMTISGIARQNSDPKDIIQAQDELADTCPNVIELDLSYNPIETWKDVEDICRALPKLRILRLNSIRFRELPGLQEGATQGCFPKLQELHLSNCLLRPHEILTLLYTKEGPKFPTLQTLWISQNEIGSFSLSKSTFQTITSITTVILENNYFTNLDSLFNILNIFPNTSHVSLQANRISSFGNNESTSPSNSYPLLTNLNLADNEIDSFTFVDSLVRPFPNLSALRISRNLVYNESQPTTSSTNPAATAYYLTLARLPNLKSLNYTIITPREREEGEIYYLSTADKDIRTTLLSATDRATTSKSLLERYPRYTTLCEKHDRDNLITQLTDPFHPSVNSTLAQIAEPTHPAGAIASRLVMCTFHVPGTGQTFTQRIPRTIATSTIFALASRELDVPRLGFKLVYESEELDPVRDDLTTRSQISADRSLGAKRWDDWGDWDADELVERSVRGMDGDGAERENGEDVGGTEGRWTDDGVLIKDGRKWKRREVDIFFGLRSFGDWLEDDVKACRFRVEPFERT